MTDRTYLGRHVGSGVALDLCLELDEFLGVDVEGHQFTVHST